MQSTTSASVAVLLCLVGLLGPVRAGAGNAQAGPVDTTDWSAIAEQDLAAIRAALDRNHPAAVDDTDSTFQAWFQNGYADAHILAMLAQSQAGYRHALAHYVHGFQDGHVNLRFEHSPPVAQWPGFLVTYVDSHFVVTSRAEPGPAFGPDAADASPGASSPRRPPVGAQLVSCDGHTAQALADTILRAYEPIWSVRGARPRVAPQLFADHGNPFVDRPEHCVFVHDGKRHRYPLRWETLPPEALERRVEAARRHPRSSFALRRFGSGGYWISVSSFDVLDEPTVGQLDTLLRRIRARRTAIRDAPVVVLDVRGNSGGASIYGTHLAILLWGDAFVDQFLPRVERAEWRASETNIAYMKQVQPLLEDRFGPESEVVAWWSDVLAGMKRAREQGAPFYHESPPSAASGPGSTAPSSPVAGDVYLLTDSSCFSACLDFADLVLRFPNVTHVGRETSADTPYMETASVSLPSGRAQFIYPMKVYRGRERAANESHRPAPAHRWTGSMAHTEALERWIWRLATED